MTRLLRMVSLMVGGLFGAAALAGTESAWRAFPIMNRAEASRGEVIYRNLCEACHGDGVGHPGTAALAAKYHGQLPALLTKRTDLSIDGVKYYVRHGVSIMPFYRKTELSDPDLDDLARFLARPERLSVPAHSGR
jgi:mono/diheme cytochrome c family protein